MAHNAEPVPGGRRLMSWGQTGALSNIAVDEAGNNDDLAVAHVKWLLGGATSGTIWCSSVNLDYSYWWGGGATSENDVGSSCRTTLSNAGYTISLQSDSSEEFDYADGLYDCLIVGSNSTWGSGLSDAQKGAQLRAWVNDGGALLHVQSESGSHDFAVDPMYIQDSSSVYAGGTDDDEGLTGATASFPILFPSGYVFNESYPHYVYISGGAQGAYRQQAQFDSDSSYFRFAWYSYYGDCEV